MAEEKAQEITAKVIERPAEVPPEVAEYIEQIETQLTQLGNELDAKQVAEARGIVWGDLWGVVHDSEGVRHEIKFHCTSRSMIHPINAFQSFFELLTFAKTKGVYPYLPTPLAASESRTASQPQATAPAPQAPAAPSAPSAPSAPAPPTNGGGEVKTGKVKQIVVEKPGSVKVYYTDQYYVQSHIGAAGIAGFFDESLGWTAANFETPTIYPSDQVSNLTVEWKKNAKGFNDIQRIYVAG